MSLDATARATLERVRSLSECGEPVSFSEQRLRIVFRHRLLFGSFFDLEWR